MSSQNVKDQLDVLESYIDDLPMVIDPCRICKYIDEDKMLHHNHADVCEKCCWYYDSKFEVGTK